MIGFWIQHRLACTHCMHNVGTLRQQWGQRKIYKKTTKVNNHLQKLGASAIDFTISQTTTLPPSPVLVLELQAKQVNQESSYKPHFHWDARLLVRSRRLPNFKPDSSLMCPLLSMEALQLFQLCLVDPVGFVRQQRIMVNDPLTFLWWRASLASLWDTSFKICNQTPT